IAPLARPSVSRISATSQVIGGPRGGRQCPARTAAPAACGWGPAGGPGGPREGGGPGEGGRSGARRRGGGGGGRGGGGGVGGGGGTHAFRGGAPRTLVPPQTYSTWPVTKPLPAS